MYLSRALAKLHEWVDGYREQFIIFSGVQNLKIYQTTV